MIIIYSGKPDVEPLVINRHGHESHNIITLDLGDIIGWANDECLFHVLVVHYKLNSTDLHNMFDQMSGHFDIKNTKFIGYVRSLIIGKTIK